MFQEAAMKKFLLRLFYWPSCLLGMCDDRFVGYFIEPDGRFDYIGHVYRTRCPHCGKDYVRNTNDKGSRLPFTASWERLWAERQAAKDEKTTPTKSV